MRPAYLLTLLKKFDADVAHQVPDGARERVTMSVRDGERRHRDVESDVQLETRESRHDVPRARGETGKRIFSGVCTFAPLHVFAPLEPPGAFRSPGGRGQDRPRGTYVDAQTQKKVSKEFSEKTHVQIYYFIICYNISMET